MASTKRIAIGLVTSIAILAILDLLPSPIPSGYASYRLFDYFYVWPAVGGMVTMFVAAFCGAYVSKAGYIVPAVLLAVAVWVFAIYFLNSIGAAAGQDDILAVASTNLLGLIFGIGGAALGAYVGTRMVERSLHRENVAAH
jgi:hypothetical protein